MEHNEIMIKTKSFLQRYVGDREIGVDEKIFASGLVNSLYAMQLVLFLENEFKIAIENQDLDLKNFMSLNSIAEFVLMKKQ